MIRLLSWVKVQTEKNICSTPTRSSAIFDWSQGFDRGLFLMSATIFSVSCIIRKNFVIKSCISTWISKVTFFRQIRIIHDSHIQNNICGGVHVLSGLLYKYLLLINNLLRINSLICAEYEISEQWYSIFNGVLLSG